MPQKPYSMPEWCVPAILAAALVVVGAMSLVHRGGLEREREAFALRLAEARGAEASRREELYGRLIADFADNAQPEIRDGVSAAMLEHALSLPPGTEKFSLFDAVVARHGGIAAPQGEAILARAMIGKAGLLIDPAAKTALLDAVIDRFGESERGEMRRITATALLEKAEAVAGDDRAALYDRVLAMAEAFPSDVPLAFALSALGGKAALEADFPAKIAVYDRVVALGEAEPNAAVQFRVASALRAKAELATDPAEKERIYDEIIARYRNAADPSLQDAAFRAIRAKAEALRKPEDAIAFYDREIAGSGDDMAPAVLAQILGAKAAELVAAGRDAAEVAAVYDEIIDRFAEAGDGPARYEVAKAFGGKAALSHSREESRKLYSALLAMRDDGQRMVKRLQATAALELAALTRDPAEKIRIYDDVVARFDPADSMLRRKYQTALEAKAALTGDAAPLLAYYDRLAAESANDNEVVAALIARARLTADADVRMRLYDAIIARGGDSVDPAARDIVIGACFAKAALIADAGERVRLADRAIALLAASPDPAADDDSLLLKALAVKADASGDRTELAAAHTRIVDGQAGPARKAAAVLRYLEYAGDAATQIAALDALIAEWEGKADKSVAVRAKAAKAALLRSELEAVYAGIRADVGAVRLPQSVADIAGAYRAAAALEPDPAEKIRLYDGLVEFLDANAGGDGAVEAALEKAALLRSSAERNALYDALLERYGSGDAPASQANAIRIILAKSEFEDAAGRAALLDQIVNAYRDMTDPAVSVLVDEAFARRAER